MHIKKYLLSKLRRLSVQIYKFTQPRSTATAASSNSTQPRPISYHSLSPVDDAEVKDYIEALKWALDNRKEKAIFNIALTGPYGSGKSSILKTFKKENNNKDYVFLDISLATFKEELPETTVEMDQDESEDKKSRKNNDEILRLIELSILQQIFYHEEDEKIPDSRFKKIKTLNRKSLYYITGGLLLAVLFGFYLFFPARLEKLLMVKIGELTKKILHYVSLVGFCVALVTAVYRSVRILYSLRISKIKFQETEIEIDKGISKSILNNHLDEILYFFEATPYSVVIIEDLDRFRQAEIFTKLRELNLLINNSKKLKGKHVVFIYAVRDEMFQDKDRTKFFDFIIPVIPVINSSNSKEKLSAIALKNSYNLSPELIDDVSLFIDDMRLLYNIMNEYAIYSKLLDKGLNRDKLLAILIYKNIWPDDFVLLGNNGGTLFKLLNKKTDFIRNNIAKIDDKIRAFRDVIKTLQETMLKNTYELRLLYVAQFASEIGSVSSLTINGNDCNLETVASETFFEYFKKGKFKYFTYRYYDGYYYTRQELSPTLTFNDLENKVDPISNYEERLKAIQDVFNNREEILKEEIETLERQKQVIRHYKIKEILNIEPLNIDNGNKKEVLLNLLLRNGYIDEDYQDYISLFYEGSLTRNDRTFVLNVKSQIVSEYDNVLNKFANIIGKFKPHEFSSPYLLNYSLINFLLSNVEYEVHLNYFFGQLNDSNQSGLDFMDGYITVGEEIGSFISKLVNCWPGILKYVDGLSNYSQEKRDSYILLILEYAKIEDLRHPEIKDQITCRIEKMSGFLELFTEQRVTILLETLEPKFEYLTLQRAPKNLIDVVIDANYYQISVNMVKEILYTADNFDLTEFEERNYATINNTAIIPLTKYLNNNINDYINKIYLQLPNNIHDGEEELYELLNNTDIKIELRKKILERSETILSSLAEIEDSSLDGTLLKNEKIMVIWENVISYYERHGEFDDVLTNYLNKISTALKLAENDVPLDSSAVALDATENLMQALINHNGFNDDAYEILVKSITYAYDMSEVIGIGRLKLAVLIKKYLITFSQANLEAIRSGYPGLQLNYLEQNKSELFNHLDKIMLNSEEVAHLLKSDYFNNNEKQRILDSINEDQIIKSKQILQTLYSFVISADPLTVSKETLVAMLQIDFNLALRVKLFNTYHRSFGPSDTVNIFRHFPTPFDKIGEKHKSPVIKEMNDENKFLAINLKEMEMISNYRIDEKGIKIINFKWK